MVNDQKTPQDVNVSHHAGTHMPGVLNGTKEITRALNAYLDDLQKKVYEAHSQLTEADAIITAESIRNKFLGKGEQPRSLMEIFKDHNQKVAALVGKEYTKGTLCRYQTALKHTGDFLKWKYNLSDIDIKKIDHAFLMDFEFYLRSERKCANNSAVKYIRNFGKIIRICIANRWLTYDPFLNYKNKVKTVDRVYLTTEEIQEMADKDMATDRLTQVRDIFLFCCFTGLAYADVKKLHKWDIVTGIDGEKLDHDQKAKDRYTVPYSFIAHRNYFDTVVIPIIRRVKAAAGYCRY